MSWNYRVCLDIRSLPAYSIREVYYDEAGVVKGWTSVPVTLTGESPDEIKADLELVLRDTFSRSVLDITDEDNPKEVGP